MPKFRTTMPLLLASALLILAGVAQCSEANGHWVSAWGAAVHSSPQLPFLPPPPVFENQTIRMVVRPTLGGDRIRVRFSNEFGTAALAIGSAHIALERQGAGIVPESDRILKFGGNTSVSVPPGSPILSDPVDLKVPAFTEIAVSIYLPTKTTLPTTHFWGQHETYISGPGDFCAQADIANATTKTAWYFLADVEVWAAGATAVAVTLGDSITDGVGAKQGDYTDWPDMLARRLAAGQGSSVFGVVNEGIGGNRILHDGAGVSALARLDRDVLAQPGVTHLIVMEGINDIGWPHIKPPSKDGAPPPEMPFAQEVVSAQDLIMGLQQIIERAHQHGIRVFGATLTPYEGSGYYTVDGEGIRQAVNQWIRTGGAFDGVFDFDAVVRDPTHPSQFREGYHSGDHLHPSATGYKAMADAIDLSLLKSATGTGKKK